MEGHGAQGNRTDEILARDPLRQREARTNERNGPKGVLRYDHLSSGSRTPTFGLIRRSRSCNVGLDDFLASFGDALIVAAISDLLSLIFTFVGPVVLVLDIGTAIVSNVILGRKWLPILLLPLFPEAFRTYRLCRSGFWMLWLLR